MQKKKRFLISVVLVLTMFSTIFAYADNGDSISKADLKDQAQLERYFDENGVPSDKQEILMDKVKNNELWDCYDQSKLDQIPEDFKEFDPGEGSQEKYYRFEDGSFIKVEAVLNQKIAIDNTDKSRKEIKEKIKNKKALDQALSISQSLPTVQPNGVEYGTGYVHYYDYKIQKIVGTMKASYYAEFFIVQNGPDSIVDSAYSPAATGFGSLSSMPEFTYVRLTEDVARSRYALMYSSWIVNYDLSTPWGGASVGGSTCFLYLAVGKDKFYVDNVLPY